MRKMLYANYIILFMSFIIWSQIFGKFHIVISVGTFLGLFYLNLAFSKWLLKCPKCKSYIFKTPKGSYNSYFKGFCRNCGEKFE